MSLGLNLTVSMIDDSNANCQSTPVLELVARPRRLRVTLIGGLGSWRGEWHGLEEFLPGTPLTAKS